VKLHKDVTAHLKVVIDREGVAEQEDSTAERYSSSVSSVPSTLRSRVSVIENDLHNRAHVLAEPLHLFIGFLVHGGQKLDAVGQGL